MLERRHIYTPLFVEAFVCHLLKFICPFSLSLGLQEEQTSRSERESVLYIH